jgi:DNA polymerase III delta prime subunit
MKKSDQVNELHEKAMKIAQAAFVARMQSELENVKQLSSQAFEYERQAAMLLLNDYDIEPTRSVLFRSAASLALNFKDYREAERMIALGLLGNPPPEILEELRELFISNIPIQTEPISVSLNQATGSQFSFPMRTNVKYVTPPTNFAQSFPSQS